MPSLKHIAVTAAIALVVVYLANNVDFVAKLVGPKRA